jgi:hypothetical protein
LGLRASLDGIKKEILPRWESNSSRPARCRLSYHDSISSQSQVKVKVTLRLTVSQSVRLGVEPNLGLLTRDFFSKLLSCLLGAPSLTRGRVCHASVFVIEVYNSQSLFTKHIYICNTFVIYISNELFLVVILVLSYLLVSINFSLKLFTCKSCSLLTHGALSLFIWRCATEHSSSCL